MKKVLKRILLVFLILVGIVVLVIGGYLAYLQVNFYRNVDGSPVDITADSGQKKVLDVGGTYTALTYNIGFGAYDPSYTCFMDTGVMADGTPTQGTHAWATSEQQMYKDLDGVRKVVEENHPDFCCIQEVDQRSDRTFGSDQVEYLTSQLSGYGNTYALNFHTAYLAYPFNEPLGFVRGGLLTLSRYDIAQATWGSYPIDMSFITKFTDLDRGFTVNRIATDDGKQLVVVDSHMSAYDSGGIVRAQQLQALNVFLTAEAAKGNYVIVGGDYNQTIGGTESSFDSGQQTPSWVATFDEGDLAKGFHMVKADNLYDVPTCRGADIPWQKGFDYTCVIDGFIVSDNVTADARNIETDFANSDHNPVLLTFKLGDGTR